MLLKLSLPEAAKPGMRAKPVEEQWKFVEMYAASGGAGGFEAADSAAAREPCGRSHDVAVSGAGEIGSDMYF